MVYFFGFPEGFVEHDMRTVEGLEAALGRVDAILRNAGIDTRIETIIQRETLQEQMKWLENARESIERRIESARAELHAMVNDEEVERIQAVLDCPEQHDKVKQKLRRKAEEYKEMAEKIQKDIERLFK